MTNPVPGAPFLQRSCALCGTVDDGPRHAIALPSGATAYYHLDNNGDGVSDCPVPGADPRPDLDEPASVSQQRHALTHDPNSPTPSDAAWLTTHTVDASDPDAEEVVLSVRPDDTPEV